MEPIKSTALMEKQSIGQSTLETLDMINKNLQDLTELLHKKAGPVMLPDAPAAVDIPLGPSKSGQPFFDSFRDKAHAIMEAVDSLKIQISRIEV